MSHLYMRSTTYVGPLPKLRRRVLKRICFSGSSGHVFATSKGDLYEWRKNPNTMEPGAYDVRIAFSQILIPAGILADRMHPQLFTAPAGARIAGFRRFPQPRTMATVTGTLYGSVQHVIEDDELMLYALLALCVNRWIDMNGM